MIVEALYQPNLEDFKKNGEMELKAILKLFENTGSKHSDIAGDGILNRTNSGNAWVFTDWQVEIFEYPKYGDEIISKTWSEPVNAIFSCSRDFELYRNGKLAAIATTRWAIIDLTTARPSKIEKELLEKYEPEEKKTFPDTKLTKIAIPDTFDAEKEITPRRTDIDFNNHVHNLTYLDYAMETLPLQIYENRNFKHLRISYKSQLQYGETAQCKYKLLDGKQNFNIFGKDNQLKTQIELY